jgi:hemerythrin-like metal-binding protein
MGWWMLSVPLWTDEFLVGSKLINLQHKRLLLLCGQLIRYSSDESHTELAFLLEEFAELVRMHFKTEEVLLAKNGCPTLEWHRTKNAMYLAQLAELQHQEPLPLVLLREVLSVWITDHLESMDISDKHYLQDTRKWVNR